MSFFRPYALSTLLLIPAFSAADGLSESPRLSIWELDSVEVEGVDSDPSTSSRDARQMTRQIITDSHSLVRDMTGVSVTSGGRSGTSGYAMRGVDQNRVAITVDGVAQAEHFLPEIFSGYGYMNGSRNDVEMEQMKQATVHKGPDSFLAGSGAIGGSVQFVTRDINDFVAPDRRVAGVARVAYRSSTREWVGSGGAGVRLDRGNSLFVQYTRRHGHERKNFDGGEDISGSRRERPDPVTRTGQSWLGKLNLCATVQHCLLLTHAELAFNTYTDERSYNGFGQSRLSRDSSPQQRDSIAYRWLPDAGILERLEAGLNRQHIEQRARTRNFSNYDGFMGQFYDRNTRQNARDFFLQLHGRKKATSFGTHKPAFEAWWNEHKLTNRNADWLYFARSDSHLSTYSIIDPVRTRQVGMKVLDQFEFGPRWTGQVGWRMDRYTHKRQAGVAQASRAEVTDIGEKRFSNNSAFMRLSFQLMENTTLAYGVSQGFRAPSAQELYFRLERFGNYYSPNPDLKPERALNQEITLATQGRLGNVALSTFYTRYRNFIEQRHLLREVPNPWYGQDPRVTNPTEIEQVFRPENVDRASIWGLELKGRLDMHEAFGSWKGLAAEIKGSFARGRTSEGDSLRALQPLQVVAGLAYDAPRWGVRTDLVYHAAKRERDTLRTSYSFRGNIQRPAKYLSNSVLLTDVTAYALIRKDTTLSVGIYNLFNRKYFNWDDLRSIPAFGSTGMVHGNGINRFSSPGRNVAASLEIRF